MIKSKIQINKVHDESCVEKNIKDSHIIKYDKSNKYHLLIQNKLWQLIKSGIKQWEFRKLEKGLISGKYYYFDADIKEYFGNTHLQTNSKQEYINMHGADECYRNFGGQGDEWCNAHEKQSDESDLQYGDEYIIYTFFGKYNHDDRWGDEIIDKYTFNWLKENYFDKHEFMAYKISNVVNYG